MSRFQNKPPANCAGHPAINCGRCDRFNPFGGEFDPDLSEYKEATACLSFSDRYQRPDYQEVKLP